MIKDFLTYLSTTLGVTSVYVASIPQGAAVPAMVVFQVSGGLAYADDGEVGLNESRVQVDCWAETSQGANEAADDVVAALSAVQDVTEGDTTFIYIMLDNRQNTREGGGNVSEYRHRAILDFIVIWR
jgi:hypothetical protein